MTKIEIRQQPDMVKNAIRRLLRDHRFAETPELARNAVTLIIQLHESGVSDEDDLVELAALSGGKRLAGTATSGARRDRN